MEVLVVLPVPLGPREPAAPFELQQPILQLDVLAAVARKAAGLPEALVHDFRRTAVRNLERAGVSRSVAMSLTGHKTESVYRRYAIVDAAAQKEGVAKLAALPVGERTSLPFKRANEQ